MRLPVSWVDFPESLCPQCHADGDSVIGLKQSVTGPRVPQAASHKPQQLTVYAVRTVLVKYADPGGYRPFNRGKADQVIVLYGL